MALPGTAPAGKNPTQRLQAFERLVIETALVLHEEFPTITVELAIRPKPLAVLRHVIDELYSFEIAILPLPSGYVGFELYRIDRTVPTHAMESWRDEGSLLGVRRYLRENTRLTLKKIKEEDVLTPLLKTEYAHNAKYNARFRGSNSSCVEPVMRRSGTCIDFVRRFGRRESMFSLRTC